MGGGHFDNVSYRSSSTYRRSKGIDDFHYSKTAHEDKSLPVHPNLDPKRIKDKPFSKLESRDSAEHPNSNAVFVSFDVTGSNIENARRAQQKLPNLMKLLETYLPDPQVAFAANDDYLFEGKRSVQISDFESDNRIDEHLRNIILVGDGGGNFQESYDLILLAAANMTVLDCFEKRGRKGYFFMYADEPIPTHVDANQVHDIFGISAQGKLPIDAVIKKLKEQYHVFVMWPANSSYTDARAQYVHLFGNDCVFTLQHPDLICEMIGSLIGKNEKNLSKHDLVTDLVASGTSSKHAHEIAEAITVR
jgi:hypothetical protein